MKIRFIIPAFILAVLISYCKQKKDIQSILSINCYWDIWDKNSEQTINTCYKFNSAGICGYYYYNFFNKRRTDSVYLFDDDDVVVQNKWNVKGDSIQIRANKYLIIRYNTDTIYLTAVAKDTIILIKNCSTFKERNKR
jgi:hypothetical protein